MITSLIIIFVIAYAAIALEHPININKSASALLGAGLLWTVYAIATNDHQLVDYQLSESIANIGVGFVGKAADHSDIVTHGSARGKRIHPR